ncbi:MAG: hypothetical protein KY468_17185 [Armatimonadetes bacterium]|nr:hypothetical protein [Armatimonadota bacterium]
MPITEEEIEAIDPIAPPFYSGPEFARIREKAKKIEAEGIAPDIISRVEEESERIAWGRAKYQKLRSPSKSMREFARQEVLCRVYDETHKRKRGYG